MGQGTTILTRTEAAYKQIAGRLREQIALGLAPVGSMLPSYRRLAEEYGVSPAMIEDCLRWELPQANVA